MKNILILGGFGFIGTNLLKYIDDNFIKEYRIIVFDRFSTHFDGILFKCVIKTYAGDFSDKHLINKIFKENHIDIVLHSLSASIPSSSIDNTFDIQVNVIPTVNLLDIMREYNVSKIIFISSGGAIYGDHYVYNDSHREDEVLFPKSAYGLSKLIIEKYLYLYNIQCGLKSLVLRLSNPYGPYHYSKKQGIINIAIEAALNSEKFYIWGDGEGRKDYIYIEDFCNILFKLIKQPWDAPYRVINIGSGNLLSVNQIIKYIKNIYPNFTWEYKDSNLLDVSDFKLDLYNLNKLVKTEKTKIEEGLMKTKQWYDARKTTHHNFN